MSQEAINQALSTVKYPGFSRDIVSFGLVRSVDFKAGRATVSISVTTNDHSVAAKIRDDVEAAVTALDEVEEIEVNVSVNTGKKTPAPTAGPSSPGKSPLESIKNVIAIASGKGGVGKSTFSANLACALQDLDRSKKVGLLDCDIYGPSIPLMMGINRRPEIEGESIVPLENHGVKIMSMGFLIDEETPVIWRGPMIQKTIQQFIHNVIWGELDTLLIDLPPGTGDAQLSLVQTIPLSGALIITTPQTAATQVARRGAKMLEKTNVPILGIAENMSYIEYPDGSRNAIFGEGGGQSTADELSTELLGQIPLDPSIREGGDSGIPLTKSSPDSSSAKAFLSIAEKLMSKLS